MPKLIKNKDGSVRWDYDPEPEPVEPDEVKKPAKTEKKDS